MRRTGTTTDGKETMADGRETMADAENGDVCVGKETTTDAENEERVEVRATENIFPTKSRPVPSRGEGRTRASASSEQRVEGSKCEKREQKRLPVR